MNPSTLYWAKTGEKAQDYHPLIAHSADVAAVMAALVEPPSAIHDRLVTTAGPAADPEALVAVLVYLAGVHDIGKANHGFQDKAGPLKREGRHPWISTGHVRPLVNTMGNRLHTDAWLALLQGLPWDQEEQFDMLLTAICHHGRPWDLDMRPRRDRLAELWTPDRRTGRDPLQQVCEIGQAARRWAGMPRDGWIGEPFSWTPALANLFAGLLVTADWVGSSRSIFGFTREAESDPDSYWKESLARARAAVREIGLRPPRRDVGATGIELFRTGFPQVFTANVQPTPLQERLATTELPPSGSRVVVESDTGSGKTEAILALYARLRAAGQVDGLLFALPTRATASSMKQRVEAYLTSLHPGGSPPTVALAMGGAAVHPSDTDTPLPSEGQIHEEGGDRDLRAWASRSTKRFFAAEVVVGTVDQVLLAGLPVKHAHHRMGLLSRHLLVVDELHSYDRYMAVVLKAVVDLLCGAGGMAAFLSATLSSGTLHRLIGARDSTTLAEATAQPYPSVTVAAGGIHERHPAPSPRRARDIRWTLGPWDQGLERAVSLAREGARVCILRNTVREAREAANTLAEAAPDLLWRPAGSGRGTPVHSRYTPPDRAALDHALLNSFGKESTDSGVILISTQIVEQSLDLDFDWMLTDLAPVDVLLQRIGRVHRHARPSRPAGADRPTLFVHSPEEGFEARAGSRPHGGWGTVYEGIMDLELTRRIIEANPVIELPRMSRALIEGVYHDDARQALVEAEPDWEPVDIKESGALIGGDIHGKQMALDFTRSYWQLAERFEAADEEKIRTRIGDDRVTVELDHAVPGWYARNSETRQVPLSLRDIRKADLSGEKELVATWVCDTEDGLVFSLGTLELRYGRAGWFMEKAEG